MSVTVTAGLCLQPSAQAASFALSTELAILSLATQCKSASSTLAEFLHSSTPLSFAGNPPTQYEVCAWPSSLAAGTGKEPGREGTGNPVREIGYSGSTAELRSSCK